MSTAAHWLLHSPFSRLPELVLFLLAVLYMFRPRGGSGRPPALTSTSLGTGTSSTRRISVVSSSRSTPGGLSEAVGFPLTRHHASNGTVLGWSGNGMPGHGANGAPLRSADSGEAA